MMETVTVSVSPRVSILMPVYNAARYVGRAIRSVLAQTFGDFELLVLDDGSTDGALDVVRAFRDPRIRICPNERNLGVAATLNRGLDLAVGEYVVRLDADDWCVPGRVAAQVSYMEHHPGTGVCGSWVRCAGGHFGVVMRRPVGPDAVRAFLCLDNPLFHPTVIMRRDLLERYGLRYGDAFPQAEDFDLWTQVAVHAALDNIPAPLVRYRLHGGSVTATSSSAMEAQSCELLRRELAALEVEPSPEQLQFHRRVGHGCRLMSGGELRAAEAWLLHLHGQNERLGVYTEAGMASALGFVWFQLCASSAPLGAVAWRQYRKSPLRDRYGASPCTEVGRFLLSLAWHALRRSAGGGMRRTD